MVEVERIPEELRRIIFAAELQALNDSILAALTRYKQLVNSEESDFFRSQIEDIYNDVVRTRTHLQVRSKEGEPQFAALGAIISPVAMLLELGLLYRLGSQARKLRKETEKSYQDWFALMLDSNLANSVAADCKATLAALAASDTAIQQGCFNIASQKIGNEAALYCLEHQIGSTALYPLPAFPPTDPTAPRRSWADVLNETWIRIYFIGKIDGMMTNGVPVFDISNLASSFRNDQYARAAHTGAWYPPGAPAWEASVDTYDSTDLQRFRGENHAQRVADILNSPKWAQFCNVTLPAGILELGNNNELRVRHRFDEDVLLAVTSSSHVFKLAENRMIDLEAI
jgi:hypothetical protein